MNRTPHPDIIRSAAAVAAPEQFHSAELLESRQLLTGGYWNIELSDPFRDPGAQGMCSGGLSVKQQYVDKYVFGEDEAAAVLKVLQGEVCINSVEYTCGCGGVVEYEVHYEYSFPGDVGGAFVIVGDVDSATIWLDEDYDGQQEGGAEQHWDVCMTRLEVAVSTTDSSASEAGGDAQFEVSLAGAIAEGEPALELAYSTGGTADEGDDFDLVAGGGTLGGHLTIEPGTLSMAVSLVVHADARREGVETADFELGDAGGLVLLANPAHVVQINDDPIFIEVVKSNDADEDQQQPGSFKVTRTSQNLKGVRVYFDVSGGMTLFHIGPNQPANVDGRLTGSGLGEVEGNPARYYVDLPEGAWEAQVNLEVYNDHLVEGTEQITITPVDPESAYEDRGGPIDLALKDLIVTGVEMPTPVAAPTQQQLDAQYGNLGAAQWQVRQAAQDQLAVWAKDHLAVVNFLKTKLATEADPEVQTRIGAILAQVVPFTLEWSSSDPNVILFAAKAGMLGGDQRFTVEVAWPQGGTCYTFQREAEPGKIFIVTMRNGAPTLIVNFQIEKLVNGQWVADNTRSVTRWMSIGES